MNVSSEGIKLGFLFAPWGGLLIACGAAAGLALAYFETKRRREDPALVYHLFTPLVVWGIIGARLWYLFAPPLSAVQMGLTAAYYLSNPLDALALWLGGYGIPGLWLGGLLALLIVARQNEISFWNLADLLAPSFVLAHLIGRLGDFFNQQLYGAPSSLPWAVFISPEYRLAGFENVEYYHPLFAYEALALALCFVWMMKRARKNPPAGELILTYAAFYSALRFSLEFLRLDVALLNGWNVNQIFFAAAFALSAAGLSWKTRQPARAKP